MLTELDKKKIIFYFNRAAASYDSVAALQPTVGNTLLQRLAGIRLQPQTILDLGCGTGQASLRLQSTYPTAQIIAFDKAAAMLKQGQYKAPSVHNARLHWLNGEAESLPFRNHSIDLVYSNLMLHWSNDFAGTLSEIKRILKPNGLLLFTLVGTDTLKELRSCWAQADNRPHVHVFPDLHDIGDILTQVNFSDSVLDIEHFTLRYATVVDLMRDLKQLGAQNTATERHRALTSKKALRTVVDAYECFRDSQGKLPATWEIVYGHAWATALFAKPITTPSEMSIPIAQIGGRNVRTTSS